jgi:ATP-dependent helicase/nuclease subunit A
LQGFLAWLRAADTEVKRDMEISRDEVRVMTVHGAKGLEAAVVFMVDTTSSPSDTQRLRLIHLPGSTGEVVVWAGRKADDPAAVASARLTMLAETEDEYRRLLYVAMTRAADRLIVSGCMPGNMNNVRQLCWYDLVRTGLANSGLQEETIETPDGPVKRYSRPDEAAMPAGGSTAAATSATIELPSWLRTQLDGVSSAITALRPSDSGGESRKVRSDEAIVDRARAIQRGTLVHRLLQSLPDIAPERRRDAALNYLGRNATDWSDGDRVQLAQSVLSLIGDPRFAAVFAADSRAEVAIVGRLALAGRPEALVSGQIDRLVVTPEEVLIVDFKTNQAPPPLAAAAPASYVRQLALYRAILRKLYPRFPVRAALLWTETAEFMEISAPALDAELASFGAGGGELDPATRRS